MRGGNAGAAAGAGAGVPKMLRPAAAGAPAPMAANPAGTIGVAAAASPIAITPPHTEQRARTPPSGILAGSTRKIEPHSGQIAFIEFAVPA